MSSPKTIISCLPRCQLSKSLMLFALGAPLLLFGCSKEDFKPPARPPAQVSVIRIEPKDTPLVLEFLGQTQSSHQVEIRARVNGFLDKRTYAEGSLVEAGDVMFRMDPKPFQAQLEAEQGALAQQQARLTTAQANLARVKPLVEEEALSRKDLDDATGQEQAAAAAVETAKARVEQAKLNLSYTTITTPVSGFSSYARIQDGAYVDQASSLLTYVYKVDPIWVSFSISENEMLKYRTEAESGRLRLPKDGGYEVEVVLGDGSIFPKRGRITFGDAVYNQQTGTFLVRATLPNPGAVLRPGQFVRARLIGAMRPHAVLVPQGAVQQGAKGHFIWVVNKEGKAEARPVVVGEWMGNNWFVTEGLTAGDQVVVGGSLALRPGEPVTVKVQPSIGEPAPGRAAPKPQAGKNKADKGEK